MNVMVRACLTTALALLAPFALTSPMSGAQGAPQIPAPVRDGPLEARTRTVASELRCPVCQGLSINDSPSELAQEMKGVVRDRLAGGESPAQVKAYFVQKYGEWILLEPEARGFNLVVYLLPLGVVLGGLAVVVLALRRWTRAPIDEEDVDAALAREDAADAEPALH